ncbi:MAG: STAS domain-containing protein [Desulfobacterales bacterium]|nr:STAS domain-containing protein [Desulfobacterales bacterium]MCP4159082.1 STAS domain-containing protein [Deltaproteobacteria bacterium]
MKTLSINHEKKDLIDIIKLDGILNADTALSLDAILKPLSEGQKPYIIMDVSELTYISSAGIGCFIGVIKPIRSKDGDIYFYNISRKVKRVFDLLDMEDFFKFFTDFDEAFKCFSS